MPYHHRMSGRFRILLLALLAVLATGMITHAADATAMSIRMALAGGGMDMADCTDCGPGHMDDDADAACDAACASSPFAGVIDDDPFGVPTFSLTRATRNGDRASGRHCRPDLAPPRPLA
ncbi:hypothetical protein [Oceanibacterium hippocampi]|uniref:hypothetical protein n=1 Tax=Oceanibacterium hippocampi TaxID=745714 RepID=UPI00111BEFC5|nr:hypothetical protein [Oceanibacterium hippocampi]